MDQKQKMKLPAGVKKHIRIEKARIRHDFLSKEDIKEQIEKLYNKFEYFILKPKQEIKKIIKLKKQIIGQKNRLFFNMSLFLFASTRQLAIGGDFFLTYLIN